MPTKSYVCGIDAGGSKSECAICAPDGAVLSSLRTEGAAFLGDEARFAQAVKRGVDAACTSAAIDARDLRVVVAGIAGVDTPVMKQHAHRALTVAFPATEVLIHNDATIALEAATSERPAGVLMGGTGSIAYGEDVAGRGYRVGGWGHIFGDEGSGYDVAVSAVSSVLRAVDGRDGETSLRARMLDHFALTDPREVIELADVAARDPSTVAAFAPQVFEAEREGDAVAGGIIARAADELAAIGVRLLKMVDPSGAATLVLGGSLLERDPHYAALVEARITARMPGARIAPPALPPVAGGLLKALAALGGVTDGEVVRASLAEGLQKARAEVAGRDNHRRVT
jgi:N-acetylglucosamine kinase-like BadF-type ATPase